MSSNSDRSSAEFHCAHLGADGVYSNMVGADWKSWGKLDISKLSVNEETLLALFYRSGAYFTPVGMRHEVMNPYTGMVQYTDKKTIFNDKGESIGEVGYEFNAMSHWETISAALGKVVEFGGIPARLIVFDNGARIMAQFVIPQTYYAAGREHNAFYTVYNGLDGTLRAKLGFTLYTPVCSNTYAAAMRDLGYSVKHTKNMGINLSHVSEQLGLIQDEVKSTVAVLDKFSTVEMDSEEVKKFLAFMMPKKADSDSKAVDNRRAELSAAISKTQLETLESVSLANGNAVLPIATAYDLFAGVTRYITGRQQNRDANSQYEFVTVGNGANMAQSAYDYLNK